jgi:hypothetical protein
VHGGSRAAVVRAPDRDNTAGYRDKLRAKTARQLRRRRQVEAIASRGSRLFWELIEQAIRDGQLDEDDAEQLLAAFAAVDPAQLYVSGGDQMPALPIRVVANGRR